MRCEKKQVEDKENHIRKTLVKEDIEDNTRSPVWWCIFIIPALEITLEREGACI
jgi:hypothetical protein